MTGPSSRTVAFFINMPNNSFFLCFPLKSHMAATMLSLHTVLSKENRNSISAWGIFHFSWLPKTHLLHSFVSVNLKTKQDSCILCNIFIWVLLHICSFLCWLCYHVQLQWFHVFPVSVARISSITFHHHKKALCKPLWQICSLAVSPIVSFFLFFFSFSKVFLSISVASCVLFPKLHLLAQNSLGSQGRF